MLLSACVRFVVALNRICGIAALSVVMGFACGGESTGRSATGSATGGSNATGGSSRSSGGYGGSTGGSVGSGGSGGHFSPDGSFSVPPCQDGGVDAGDASSDASSVPEVDPGDPPTHCIPPCIWQLVKGCRPKGQCFTHDYMPGAFPFWGYVSCAPENDWWLVNSGRFGSSGSYWHKYFSGNALCYEFAQQNFQFEIFDSWHDAAGFLVASFHGGTNVIGAMLELPTGTVYCHSPGATLSSPGELTPYEVDPSLPECAPWVSPACEPGCCGVPPELPRTPQWWP